MEDTVSLEIMHSLQLILAVGLLSGLSTWVAWKLGFFSLPMHEAYCGRVTFLDVLGAFVAFLTAEVIAVPVLFYAWQLLQGEKLVPAHLDAHSQGLINLVAIGSSAVFVGVYCALSSSRVLQAVFGENFWLSMRKSLYDLIFGMLAWPAAYPLVGLVSQLLGLLMLFFYQGPQIDQVAVKHLKDVMGFPWIFWTSVILITTLVPFLEEVLFRGFLQMWLTRVLGVGGAIVLTALTFALFHFSPSQGSDNVELISSLFVLGCFLSFLRERQRSLWAPVGLHAAFNAISILMIVGSASG